MPMTTAHLKRSVASLATNSLFFGANTLGLLDMGGEHERSDLRIVRDVQYGSNPEAKLDIVRPATDETLGVVLHIHGGGFSLLSKDTHWMVAEAFARAGYVVFNIDYRLAPEHPFPAALEDAAEAYAWVVRHAPSFGGDLSKFVLAGESAGANLILGLTVAATMQRPESYAQRVFETGIVPTHVVPASGLFDLTSTSHLRGLSPSNMVARQEVERIRNEYLDGAPAPLASPLVILESETETVRALPDFFVPYGGGDPLRVDSERLLRALNRRGALGDGQRYGRESHSFHIFMWRDQARRCWLDTFAFLDEAISERRRAA